MKKASGGTYDGVRFRNLLEYSFLKHLSGAGIDVKTDVSCDDFFVPYVYRKKTYSRPADFYVKSSRTLFEVCKAKKIEFPSAKDEERWRGTRNFVPNIGSKFSLVSEHDFTVFSLREALNDPKVSWDL